MKNKIMDRYYKGCALDAYELFGAHLCEERGCMHRMRKAFRSSAPLMTGAARDTRCAERMIRESGHCLWQKQKKAICISIG